MINGRVVLYLVAIQRGAWEDMERLHHSRKISAFAVLQAAVWFEKYVPNVKPFTHFRAPALAP